MIHVCTPYSLEKNLGKAYNEAFRLVNDDDYVCLIDYDILFLLPDTIKHLHEYAEKYPSIDVFTCYCNRSHQSSHQQMLGGRVSNNTDILHHIQLAEKQKEQLYNVTEIKGNISGFLMMLSKRLWKEVPFSEDGLKCLGVDSDFSKRLREKGETIFRMDGIYLFHIYRLVNGVQDKTHLL